MAKRLPGLPKEAQHYILSLLFQLAVPLLPLLLEFWFSGQIKPETLTLTAALYSVSVGVSSANILLFGIGIVVGILFSVAFGVATISPTKVPNCEILSIAAISLTFMIHAAERWNIHIADKKPYWRF